MVPDEPLHQLIVSPISIDALNDAIKDEFDLLEPFKIYYWLIPSDRTTRIKVDSDHAFEAFLDVARQALSRDRCLELFVYIIPVTKTMTDSPPKGILPQPKAQHKARILPNSPSPSSRTPTPRQSPSPSPSLSTGPASSSSPVPTANKVVIRRTGPWRSHAG